MTTPEPTQTGHYVQANGLNIYYEEHGHGKPLVLIHGGALSGASWRPYIAAFAEHYWVITPDSRGHGRTANPSGVMTFGLMADDVAALIQELGLQKPLICGYSDGGQVTIEIGMRYPNLAQALIIGGAYVELTEASRIWVRSILGDEQSPEVDFEEFERNDPGWVAMLQRIHGQDNWKTLMKQIKPLWNATLNYTPADFARIVAPTLVLLADRDGFVPVEEAVTMYRLLPNAELAVLPNAEHIDFIISRAKAALLQPLMLDFLERHSDTSGRVAPSENNQ